jgi:hypothetical protein
LEQRPVDSTAFDSEFLEIFPLEGDEESAQEIAATPIKDGMRPLVLYTYAESPNARANLEFFIAKGVHGAADFIFVFNGETDATELIPYQPNLKIIKRENKCFDLGTIGEVLMKDGLWKNYKRFVTLNASIRGPFFPVYASSSCWTDVFLDRVNEKVKVRKFPAGKGVH